MALTDLPRPAPSLRFGGVIAALADVFTRRAPEAPAKTASTGDFVKEALFSDCDAFRSEADLQCMMSVYPGRF